VIQQQQDNSTSLTRLGEMLQDDPSSHQYRLDRAAFTDETVVRAGDEAHLRRQLDLPGHESQIPNVNDYLTLHVGRQPVVITRSKDGQLNA
jgi:benzoate/toluate 1,2-dioxygenase alpha subunit